MKKFINIVVVLSRHQIMESEEIRNPSDPGSILVRPDMRILIGSNQVEKFNRPLKHGVDIVQSIHLRNL